MKNYKIQYQDELVEYKAQGSLYLHSPSGAEIYHIACDDEENSFAFSFATPPEDSSGLPHILEHSVLCGSKAFPIKDPFITLYKGSMHTFLNAFTAPDRTVYPASSVVKKDFFNLLRVYGDAVFFPLLKKEAFMQEGHHVQFDEEGNPQRSGIVFNEMKGSYSSHESLLAEYSFRDLFPGTPLSYDSGGDPESIPNLTYQQFKDFHQRYYQPSNCKIYLYGNIPVEESLAFLEEHFLRHFGQSSPAPILDLGSRWDEPIRRAYPSPKGESDGCSHSINWRLGSAQDGFSRIAMQVLSQILIGNGGAPLQMAIQQSPLGEDLSSISGLELDVGDMIYSLGIRGSKKEQARDFEAFILAELEKLVRQGIPEDQIEGALRIVEFREREIRGGTPFGLRLMGRLMRSWNYGGLPKEGLAFEKPFQELREKAYQKGFWQKLIQETFLDNKHFSLITLYPQGDFEEKQAEKEKAQTLAWFESLTKDEKTQWEQDLQELKLFQNEEDSLDVLEKIPFLSRDEIPDKVISIPFEKFEKEGLDIYRQRHFSNGVLYCDLGFSLQDFNLEERLWMPFLCHGLTELGTAKQSYDQLARQLALDLGGLHATPISATPLGERNSRCHVAIRIKMLEQQVDRALALLEEILFQRDFHQDKRIRELLVEMRNDMRTSIIPNGSGYAVTRAAAGVNQSTLMDELWYGITQYNHLQQAVTRWDEEGGQWLIQILKELTEKVFSRLDWISYNGQDDALDELESTWTKKVLSWKRLKAENPNQDSMNFPLQQAWQIPASVAYGAAVIQGAALDSKEYCAQQVITQLLKTGFLWEELRMKGGAYGAGAGSSGMEGYFHFSSYRDPRGIQSFNTFREGLKYLEHHGTQKDLDLALIGLVGKELKPLAPAQKSALAVRRDQYGIDDSLRQKNRQRLLNLTLNDIKDWAATLGEHWENEHRLTLLAGKEFIDAAEKDYPMMYKNRKVLGL